MKFSITHEVFEPEKDYLLVTYEGEITLNVVTEYAPRIIIAIEHHKCMKMVEDLRLASFKMDTKEIINMQSFQADYLTSRGIPFTQVKRALVVDENLIPPRDLTFFETLSVNRGQKLKIFTDMIKAIKWISE